MSTFKHALAARDAHIRTLHIALVALFLLASGMGYGWYSAPRQLTVYLPPDLRAASQRPWWEVPPATVYAFAFSVFQQINRWPTNGEADYPRNLSALRAYLTPAATARLTANFASACKTANCATGCAACMKSPVGDSAISGCNSSTVTTGL